MLTITAGMLRRLCGIEAADTSQDAAIALVGGDEQAAIEYALDPIALAAASSDAGLLATLALGVGEVLAGSYLQGLGRQPGAYDSLGLGALTLSTPSGRDTQSLADALGQKGAARLRPYLRPLAFSPIIWGDMGLGGVKASSSSSTSPVPVTVPGGQSASVGDGVTSGAVAGTLAPSSAFDDPVSDAYGDGLGLGETSPC